MKNQTRVFVQITKMAINIMGKSCEIIVDDESKSRKIIFDGNEYLVYFDSGEHIFRDDMKKNYITTIEGGHINIKFPGDLIYKFININEKIIEGKNSETRNNNYV